MKMKEREREEESWAGPAAELQKVVRVSEKVRSGQNVEGDECVTPRTSSPRMEEGGSRQREQTN